MRSSADSGNAPIELVAISILLILPLSFYAQALDQISKQLLAEQIARHTLRSLVLSGNPQQLGLANQQAKEIAASWGLKLNPEISLDCQAGCGPGDLLTIAVAIDKAKAIQAMAIQK